MISLASFQRCTAAGAFGRLEFSLLFAFWSLVTSLQSQLVYAWSVRGASTVIAVHKRWINSNGWDLFEDSPKSKTLDVLIFFFKKSTGAQSKNIKSAFCLICDVFAGVFSHCSKLIQTLSTHRGLPALFCADFCWTLTLFSLLKSIL